jgi:hypothetical protein
MARYQLIVTSAAKPGREDEYTEWCRNQHLPDVLRVPGMLSARRYKLAGEGPGRFVTIFEMETDQPFAVVEEMTRRNGTPDMPSGDAYDPASVRLDVSQVQMEFAERT